MAKISIQQAASALAKKGYRLLGPGPYDLKAKSASYRVVDPSGHTAVLTQEQVKELMSTPALKRARALSLAKRRLSLATPGGYRPQGQKLQLFIDKITNAVGNLDIIWRSEKNPDAAQSIALGRKITQQIERLLADLEGVASDLDNIYDKER